MKKTTGKTFGGRLKILRATTTLTQEELAKRLYISRSCIANYETDRRQPTIDAVKRLTDYFKVSPNYLLGESDDLFNIGISETQSRNYLKYLTKDEKLDISGLTPYNKIVLIEYFLFLKNKQ